MSELNFFYIGHDFYCRWAGVCCNFSFPTTRVFQVLKHHIFAFKQVIGMCFAAKVFKFTVDHVDELVV